EPEPAALAGVEKAVEMDVVLAHMGLDQEPRGAAAPGQPLEGAARGEDQIADSADVDDGMVVADAVDGAVEQRDHGAAPAATATLRRRAVAAWWAWQIATARASSASGPAGAQPGSSLRTIMSI